MYLLNSHFYSNMHDNTEFRVFNDIASAIKAGEKQFEEVVKYYKRETNSEENEFDYINRNTDNWSFALWDKYYFNVQVVELKPNKSNHFGWIGY